MHTHTDCLLVAWADALKQRELLHQSSLSFSPLGSLLQADGILEGGGCVILFYSHPFPPALALMCVDGVHSIFVLF